MPTASHVDLDQGSGISEAAADRVIPRVPPAAVLGAVIDYCPVSGVAAGLLLRRQPANDADPLGGTAVPPAVLSVLRARRGAGQPLPENVSSNAGGRLGRDLSAVRLHTDSQAHDMATAMQARAFTFGSDIYLGRHSSVPGTSGGDRLLAHELAHVAQNQNGAVTGQTGIGRADDPAEADADRTADRILPTLRRQAARITHGPGQADTGRTNNAILPTLRRQTSRTGNGSGRGMAPFATTVPRMSYLIRRVRGLEEKARVLVGDSQRKASIAEVYPGGYLVVYDDKSREKVDESQVIRDPHWAVQVDSGERLKQRVNTYQSQADQLNQTRNITPAVKPHTKFGTFAVDTADVGLDALTVKMEVLSNTEEMKRKGRKVDAVPVELLLATKLPKGVNTFCAAMVKPTLEQNCCQLTLTVPWKKLVPADEADPLPWLQKHSPEILIKASWLNDKGEEDHWMGGREYKGGLGRILLREPSAEEVIESERKPKTDLNALDQLKPGHRVFDANQQILKPRSNLVTNVEAESEYTIVGPDARTSLDRIVKLLQKVAQEPAKYGLEKVDDESGTELKFIDTYHDVIDNSREPAKSLIFLKNAIVMRHRNKPKTETQKGDDPGTNLFAVKGRGIDHSAGRTARLASQVYLTDDTVPTGFGDEQAKGDAEIKQAQPDKQRQLRKFISGADSVDGGPKNPFARTVQDALANKGGKLDPDVEKWLLKPVLIITSYRRKFMFHIQDGPTIEFSADVATGTPADRQLLAELGIKPEPEAMICSFEFGLGHPGVGGASAARVTATTQPDSGSQPKLASVQSRLAMFGTMEHSKKGLVSKKSERSAMIEAGKSNVEADARIAAPYVFGRMYHVPGDIENPKLVQTPDYNSFAQLRDQLMKLISSGDPDLKLAPGGSKATLLAHHMKIIPD